MSATKRPPVTYRCSECGWSGMQWVGRCAGCQAWGTVEKSGGGTRSGRVTTAITPALPISAVPADQETTRPTGLAELDRVLGGGIVAGSVLLLVGEPGIGKSTLLLEVAAQAARRGHRTLYVSGEESAAQVRLRAERTGALEDRLLLAAEVDLGAILEHVETIRPALLVVDSVQTVGSAEADGVPGGVTQVRAVADALVRVAKRLEMPTVLVGHVTKDGTVAGPRTLEHLVDVVLQVEGERHSQLRVVRAVKNRFGPVDEIGCFEVGADGICEVHDVTGLFVSRHEHPTAGSCLTVTLEGRRPLLAEVQGLITPSAGQPPRRSVSGLDPARLAMLLAVAQRQLGLQCATHDVYAATVAGASLRAPSADLAIALALVSARAESPLPAGLVAIGEVGLAGELRAVPGMRQRLSEAARLGFAYAIVPSSHGSTPAVVADLNGMGVLECPDLVAAVATLRALRDAPGATRLRSVRDRDAPRTVGN